jgi:hypothetical protein
MLTLVERISDILQYDEWNDVRHRAYDYPGKLEGGDVFDTECGGVVDDMMTWGFAYGLALASIQPEPLESHDSVSARAWDAASEAMKVAERDRKARMADRGGA